MTLVEIVLAAVLAHGNVAARDSLAQRGAARVEPGPDGGRTVVLALEFSAQPVQASVVYDASGQISSVVFKTP
jgi:hypothetical protein